MKSLELKLRQILSSFQVIYDAAKYLIKRPQNFHLIIIPVVINICIALVLFGFIYGLLLNLSNNLIEYINPDFGTNFIYSIGSALAVVIALLATWFLITSIAVIVQAPFNSKIVENILEENNVQNKIKLKGVSLIIYETSRAIRFELLKIFLIILVFILTFVLNFVPVIGPFLYLSTNIANGFFLNLLDLLDPSYERIGVNDKQEAKLTFKNLTSYGGIGIFAYIIWNIPIVNFILMPLLFTAATFAFVKVHGEANKETK